MSQKLFGCNESKVTFAETISLQKRNFTLLRFSGVRMFFPDFERKTSEWILLSGGWFFHSHTKFWYVSDSDGFHIWNRF